MRAPLRFLATAVVALAMAGCQNDPISQSATEVRLAPRWLATDPVPPVQRIQIAVLVNGSILNTLDLAYTSGQELSLGSVPSGSAFEIALVGYDTLNGGVARWGARSQGIASIPGTQDVEIAVQVPARPVVTFTGTSSLDTLTSLDSVWAVELSDARHPGRATEKQRSHLGKGALAPNVGAIVFARTDTATFIPAALATAWSSFRVVWSDTVLRVFSAPTDKAVLGSFLDIRDGRSYATTTWQGTTWLAENLAWGGVDGTLGVCPGNRDPANCTRYGRLYGWSEAMTGSTSSDTYPSKAQGICPNGWHLPSPAEWDTLGVRLGSRDDAADSLRDGSTWGSLTAKDAIGFAALPAGLGYADGTPGAKFGTAAYWWTSEKKDNFESFGRNISGTSKDLATITGYTSGSGSNEQLFSVRCVKNQP
jgi:uncharacterized protein (TIGR02145 family)